MIFNQMTNDKLIQYEHLVKMTDDQVSQYEHFVKMANDL